MSVANGPSSEKVVIDPTKGGAVSPKAAQQSKALDVQPGLWIWDGVLKVLEVDLFSAAWEVRHGAAMALRELLKVQGKCGGMRGGYFHRSLDNLFMSSTSSESATRHENEHAHEKWCNDLAAKFLCVLVLDRFGDFVSDQASVLLLYLCHISRRSVRW
jgi:TATA-binding protein-associated factor